MLSLLFYCLDGPTRNPTVIPTGSPEEPGTNNSNNGGDSLEWWVYLIIGCVVVVVILFCCYYFVYPWWKKRKKMDSTNTKLKSEQGLAEHTGDEQGYRSNSTISTVSTPDRNGRNDRNGIDMKILDPSLTQRLKNILDSNEKTWVLAIININGLKQLNDVDHATGDRAIESLEIEIKRFCEENPKRLQPFKDDTKKGVGDRFAILIKCTKGSGSSFAEKMVQELTNRIKNIYAWSISVGLAYIVKIDKEDTHKECYDRALDSSKRAKKQGNGNQYYWDEYDKNLPNNSLAYDQSKSGIIGNKEEYKNELKNLANSDDNDKTCWVLVSIDGDNIGRMKSDSLVRAKMAMRGLDKEITDICIKYKNNYQCHGYLRGGDEYSIFIKSSTKGDKTDANNIVNELMQNVRKNCPITISAGLTFLQNDELYSGWEHRAEKGQQAAKNNGKNCFKWDDEIPGTT